MIFLLQSICHINFEVSNMHNLKPLEVEFPLSDPLADRKNRVAWRDVTKKRFIIIQILASNKLINTDMQNFVCNIAWYIGLHYIKDTSIRFVSVFFLSNKIQKVFLLPNAQCGVRLENGTLFSMFSSDLVLKFLWSRS